jgi:hypothetical protein
MNIAFHSNQIGLLGTEVALYDYAHYCEKILGHKSFVISRRNSVRETAGASINQPLALKKFTERFPVFLYDDIFEIEDILHRLGIEVLYAIKRGDKDGIESPTVKTVNHVVFKYYEPHGNVYAYVSKWLSDTMTGGRSPFVPHMINLPKVSGDLRKVMNIPADATVFGRYGGVDSFDLKFVHQLIEELVFDNGDIHFLLMNTDNFLNPQDGIFKKIKSMIAPRHHKQIHFLPPTSSLNVKSRFINTCDAMLHARSRGETFGVAIGEFSIHNCPVITYAGDGKEKFEANHLEILGDKCFIYNNLFELKSIISDFKRNKRLIAKLNWDAYSEEFSPEPVMERFVKVFL